ncbi:condensation domain protein [Mycobacterium xenopi 4042]|uniref:Condensation domain protein n=1 Tax=Mycobacterium xenopi 4042 TaxID=1299334 RepID=X8ARC4_MYCXE|nr:condensation domain protein [Mycobacterium xenopi 4042]
MGAAATREAIRAEVAELLGISPHVLDPGSNLIGQGLDSIRMMALSGRWRRRGVDVDFAALAATPTIEAWSQLVSTALQGAGAPAADDPVIPQPDTPDVFPLAPMQHAIWVGRQHNQELGGVAAHLYVEFDCGAIDPERLRTAAAALARRHPMLRVRFLPDGTQRIDPAAQLGVVVHDFTDLDPHTVEHRLTEIRQTKSHQQLDGQVFELTLSLLPGQRCRLHVDLDMQAADAMSYRTLMADLAALYRGRRLPELHYTYREYRHAVARQEGARNRPRRRPQVVGPAHPGAAGPAAAARGAGTRPVRQRPALALAGPATCAALFAGARARASPRRWRWPRRSPTPWRAGRAASGSCSTSRCSVASRCTPTWTGWSATSRPRCCSTSISRRPPRR